MLGSAVRGAAAQQNAQGQSDAAAAPTGPESGAGAEDGSIERWKREAAFYEAELARRSQIWEEREQALLNEIDMRDAELNALEHRVKKAAMDVEASESARTDAVTKAQNLASRAEELEQCLAEVLLSSETQQAASKLNANAKETERLRARVVRSEEHVIYLGEMLAGVCRQEKQLVTLLQEAQEKLRQHGCSEEPIKEPLKKASTSKLKTSQSLKQPLATNNTGVALQDSSRRVASQQAELNRRAQQQVKSRLLACEEILDYTQEAAEIEREIKKLQGASRRSLECSSPGPSPLKLKAGKQRTM